jgi:hypothetical protein
MGYRVVAIEADPDLAAACRRRFRSEIDAGMTPMPLSEDFAALAG